MTQYHSLLRMNLTHCCFASGQGPEDECTEEVYTLWNVIYNMLWTFELQILWTFLSHILNVITFFYLNTYIV